MKNSRESSIEIGASLKSENVEDVLPAGADIGFTSIDSQNNADSNLNLDLSKDECSSIENNEMRIELRKKTHSTRERPKSSADYSFVRGLIKTFRKRSSSSTVSSTDSEINGYCAFPIDDELFEPVLSNRTSMISDLDGGSSSEATSEHSFDSSKGRNVMVALPRKNGTITRPQRPNSIALNMTYSSQSSASSSEPSPRLRSKSIRTLKSDDVAQYRRSYYVAGDDLSPDSPRSNCGTPTSSTPSISTQSLMWKTLLPHIQTNEIWSELGCEGGVLEIPGCGVCFHALPTVNNHPNSRLFGHRRKEVIEHSMTDLKPKTEKPGRDIDRRIVLTLDDAPKNVNNSQCLAVASMICVDYGNYEVLSSGAVLQVEVNAILKKLTKDSPLPVCKFGCLIANSVEGPFHEVSGECYHYGNTLQVTITRSDLAKVLSPTVDACTLRLIPVAMTTEVSQRQGLCVWDGISSMFVWTAVYGPKRAHIYNTCCVSMSTATICPPTLSVKKNNKILLLHLWAAHRVGIQNVQAIQVILERDPNYYVTVFPQTTIITSEEIRTYSRINKLISIKYNKETKSPCTEEPRPISTTNNSDDYSKERKNEKFLLSLIGLSDLCVILDVRFVAPVRPPSWSTPVRRWKKTVSTTPRPLSDCRENRGPQDYLYLWYDAQKQAASKLRPSFDIPGADRQVTVPHLAVAVKSRTRGKKQKVNMPLLVEYEQSDIMPVFTKAKIWCHGSVKYKEWYVGYSRGRIGLIHSQCVRLFNTDRCFDKGNGKLSVGKLIEIIVEPVGDLLYCFRSLRAKLLTKVGDWTLFSSILGFAENYISRVVREMNDDSTKDIEDKLGLFLDKFKDFCQSGQRKRHAHRDIIRALLYMGEYDFVTSIVTDFCILSIAQNIGERWNELKSILDGIPSKNDDVTILKSETNSQKSTLSRLPSNEEKCLPAFDGLNTTRERWSGNDVAFLAALHRSVGQLPDSPLRHWTYFTSALILVMSIQSLTE